LPRFGQLSARFKAPFATARLTPRRFFVASSSVAFVGGPSAGRWLTMLTHLLRLLLKKEKKSQLQGVHTHEIEPA
jgi:hypothetical protein